MTEPLSGEVIATTVQIDIPATGLVVGPDEVLVLRIPYVPAPAILQAHRDQIETVLGTDRYLIMCGDWELAKVHQPRSDKPELEAR
jgi:hypothetical protein